MNRRKHKYYLTLMLFLGVTICSKAQKIWYLDTLIQSDVCEIRTEPFTAFTLQYSKSVQPTLFENGDYSAVKLDHHITESEILQSVLYIKNDSVIRIGNAKNCHLKIIFQNVPNLTIPKNTKASFRATCNAPQMVSPSVWRSGLADPKPGPNSAAMRHCIVHHSAGGNGNTDYTSLVRNYYTQHTQVNGWDDIGYNFLIGFDGTIFIGRDKQSLTVPQYNVQGAHFCGKNAGTCGVCMVGDFNTIQPSDTMIGSLKKLLSWVFFKERREATDSTPHPSPTDSELNHIAGHRQGCATECPGNNMFSELGSIRTQVEAKRLACQQLVSTPKLEVNYPSFIIQDRELRVKKGMPYSIYNPLGALIFKGNAEKQKIYFLQPGFYLIRFSDSSVSRIYLE